MRKAVVVGIAVMLIGITLAVFAGTKLDLFSSPGGGQIGTYLGPVSILGIEDDWVAIRMTAWVPKEQVAQIVHLPSMEDEGYSRANPAPIGITLLVKWRDEYVGNISLLEVIRGAEAWQLIREANEMWNDPPQSGYEYLLVKLHFAYVEGPDQDTTYDIYGDGFTAVSAMGLEYDDADIIIVPEPELRVTLYPGASYEGWAVYRVEEHDLHPLLTFGRDYYGRGGIWFKLY